MSRSLLQKIQRKVERWGGRIEIVENTSDLSDVEIAPFNGYLAVDWHKRILYIEEESISDPLAVAGLIHEAGHVFTCRVRPSKSQDWPFFGWEYILARELGCVKIWLKANEDYGLHDCDFGDLTRAKQRLVLRERVAVAKRSRIVVDGRAVAIR